MRDRVVKNSFCVSLHEALYRQPPFAGDTLAQLRANVTAGHIRSPPRDTRIPQWLRAAILRGLATEPGDRWSSMDELLAILVRDPARARRRASVACGLGLSILAGGYGLWLAQSAGATACTGARARLDGVWDDGRRGHVQKAIIGTGARHAGDVWTRVESRLDAHTDEWVAVHTDACRAHLEGRQSDALLDARMACLEQRRAELGALVDVLAEADAAVVDRGIQAAQELRGFHGCEDMTALRARVAPPEDPEVAAAVERIRGELARVLAFDRTGQYEPAEALATRLLEEAGSLDYPPIAAETRMQHGRLLERVGQYERAASQLSEAYWIAGAAAHYEVAIEAGLNVAFVLASRISRTDDARLWLRNAEMLMARAGARPELRVLDRTALGSALENEGALAEAERVHRESLELAERTLPAEHVFITGTLVNLGLVKLRREKFDEGTRLLQRALELDERNLGPDHPELIPALLGLIDALLAAGDVDGAAALGLRARQIAQDRLEMDMSMQALVMLSRGDIARARGQLRESLALHREALALLRRVDPNDPELVDIAQDIVEIERSLRDDPSP